MYNESGTGKNGNNGFIRMKTIAEGQIFSDFNAYDYIYVDKTDYIFNILRSHRKIFISRPRRFGKSLTLDTIGTLFEYGVEPYFKDTWLYDKWTEGTYPVLRLNFLEFKKDDAEFFKKQFVEKISKFAKKHKVENYEEDSEPMGALDNLFTSLRDERRQIVILIDEYDTQLTSNINNSELYEKYQNILREIYGIFKSAPIRFLGITGVTRLKDVALFSNGSDIIDISNHTEYSQMIGFTRDEIREYYIDYLKMAACCENGVSENEVTDSQIDEILNTLAKNYDGYCFDKYGEKRVFSTWSVNNFFKELVSTKKCTYGDYWYDNGGVPKILSEYLKSHNLDLHDLLADRNIVKIVSVDDFFNPTSLPDMNRHVLMCQTGYLTLRSSVCNTLDVCLGIPNYEVYKALIRLMALRYFGKDKVSVMDCYGHNIVDIGSVEDIEDLLNRIFNSIAYDNYPVDSEASVQSHVQLFMLVNGFKVTSETHSAKGRADLMIESDNRRIIFELKFAHNENEAKAKLDEAVAQIKARDYGNILPLKKETLKIAAVFNADPVVRAFTHFKTV